MKQTRTRITITEDDAATPETATAAVLAVLSFLEDAGDAPGFANIRQVMRLTAALSLIHI